MEKLKLVKLVWLIDRDGMEHLRILHTSRRGTLWAKRMSVRKVKLNDDGTVTGATYVTSWEPY